MREIKFRAWLPKEKKMVYSVPVGADGFYHHCISEGFALQYDPQYEKLPVMQYAGTANIYEGDVIEKTVNGTKYRGAVIFGKKTLGFGIKVKYLYHTYFEENKEKKLYTDKFYRLNSNDKVIGNIYENPELIK